MNGFTKISKKEQADIYGAGLLSSLVQLFPLIVEGVLGFVTAKKISQSTKGELKHKNFSAKWDIENPTNFIKKEYISF